MLHALHGKARLLLCRFKTFSHSAHMFCSDTTLEGRLREYFGDGVTEAHLKMAETPAGDLLCLVTKCLLQRAMIYLVSALCRSQHRQGLVVCR